MTALFAKIRPYWRKITQKIWFLPTVLTLCFLGLSMLIIGLRYSSAILAVEKQLSFLALSSVDTARAVLGTLTGGLISLVVFSFSMVMVVLNQATAQFSPRLLPGLISQRQHQFILGFYLGAIIYNLSVMAQIGPSSVENSVPITAVLLAIIFGVAGLILFIRFIQAISNAVRIDTILENLHQSTRQAIEERADQEADHQPFNKIEKEWDAWSAIKANKSGYLTDIDTQSLLEICGEFELDIALLFYQGAFVHKGDELLKISKSVEEENIAEVLLPYLSIKASETIATTYIQGMQHMVEIAVKAMSPGINDPATANSAIDYLTASLLEHLRQPPQQCLTTAEGEQHLWLQPLPLSDLLFRIYTPLRTYSTGDVVVSLKMIRSLRQLLNVNNLNNNHRDLLRGEIKRIKADAQERLFNTHDQELIAEA